MSQGTQARFFDGEHAREHEVLVRLTAGGLQIEGNSVPRLLWSLSGLVLISRTQPGGALRLSHEKMPGARLVVGDPVFIAALEKETPHLSGAINYNRLTRRAAWIGAGIAAIAGLFYLVLAFAPQQIAYLLPESWREKLGSQLEISFVENAKLCAGSDHAVLRKLAARLTEGSDDTPPFMLKVYDMQMVNAFALPGGHIVVTGGLIQTASGADEVAGVVAHEIGHAAYRHPEAQIVRAMGLQVILGMVSGGGSDTISGLAGLLAVLRYSREAEREADAFAQELLVAAEIDPLALARFFERMKELAGEEGDGLFGGVLSTHPVTDERIAAIKPLPEGVKARPALSDADWRSLREICN
jgi:Zn-dependent protease with chaperone function